MKQNIPWVKLAKYFAGELGGKETKQMKKWIQSDPEREEQIKFLYKIWKESGVLPYELNTDKAWKRLQENMNRFEKTTGKDSLSGSHHKRKPVKLQLKKLEKAAKKPGRIERRVAMIAASILIILTASLFYHYSSELQKAETTGEVAIEELTTRNGERVTYILNDGSRVILHAGSRLEVPVTFNSDNRELFLEGEAYFEVTHNPDKPFIVRSEDAYTRVLGTKFLVQAWPEDERKKVEVLVKEGKVAFGESRSTSTTDQQEVIITRNQKGILAAGSNPEVTEITDLQWHFGWTEGRLVFENRQLSEILPRLERWYAVEIKAENSEIAAKKLTAEIDYSQPMREVLMGIALSLDLEIDHENQVYTFRSGGD